VIANNPHAFEKVLWSDHAVGEEIRIIRCRNEEAETERVATEILDQKLKQGLGFERVSRCCTEVTIRLGC